MTDSMVLINQLCGDIAAWRKAAEEVCRAMGFKWAGTKCCRKILPYIRLNGFRILETEETKEGPRYWCENAEGKHARFSPTGHVSPSTGIPSYYVTWEA